MKKLFLSFAFSIFWAPSIAFATDWYVDGLNGSGSGVGTKALPFLTISQAWTAAQPGDTIHLEPTTMYSVQYLQNKSGAANKPITILGDGVSPNQTQILGRNGDGPNISVALFYDHYITLSNLSINGEYEVGDPKTFECVSIQYSTHINVLGSTIKNCGGSGIGSIWSDYMTFSNNIISNNAYNTATYRGSGISTYEDEDSDTNYGIKIIVSNNFISNNKNMPPKGCSAMSCSQDTDGNGIILDDSKRIQQPGSTVPRYLGQTLVENNVVWNNGGRGISAYESTNAIIMNNTVYNNNIDPYEDSDYPAEISSDIADNIQIYNNVTWNQGIATPLGQQYDIDIVAATRNLGPITADYNLMYNAVGNAAFGVQVGHNVNPVTFGPHNVFANPVFTNPNSPYNFLLQTRSPGYSTADTAIAPSTSINGHVRVSPNIDMGAYQN